ncbi:M50 family metallopeptidase [Tenacibaculum sp. 190524A02b]|uniref:M50 family metallopeptidase n=1 Tax=Tenacibaculum vairaonense TaxID=3137860 RepID=A0ABP1F9J4_9FLAO
MTKQLQYIIFTVSILIFILLQSPYLVSYQYPFRLLGTWFHEMGHGLTALCIGGSFKYLEIYENGGGVAYFTLTNKFVPLNIGKAITAAGGLLGPAIAGTILIAGAKSTRTAAILLRVLVGVIILSLVLWIRSYWGVIVLSLFALLFFIITLLKNKKIEVATLVFLGLQSILSSYLQLDYLFTKQFERHGAIQNSDTQVIAENTFGTYWLWGLLIILVSVYLIFKSFQYYFRK